MAKSGKSSASSATRKKHARKAAVASGAVDTTVPNLPKEKKAKGKDKKGSKAEPRKKVYIPPSKPAPPRLDPLDTLGLQYTLQPELYVVLRRLGKKDAVTKTRALEELQVGWVDPVIRPPRAADSVATELATEALVQILPVWLHHYPSFFLHPSRRIRLLASALHTSLLSIDSIRPQLLSQIRDADDPDPLLGAWCLLAHDLERAVSATTWRIWSNTGPELLRSESARSALLNFTQRAILDPSGTYAYINPPPPAPAPPPVPQGRGKGAQGKGTKGPVQPVQRKGGDETPKRAEDDEERPEDRRARLRIGALGALAWILDHHSPTADLVSLLANSILWTSLFHTRMPLVFGLDLDESFGCAQPGVRSAAWGLLLAVIRKQKTSIESRESEPTVEKDPGSEEVATIEEPEIEAKSDSIDVHTLLPVLAPASLRAAWVEPDERVRAVMWEPLLKFLRDYPAAWEVEAKPDSTSNEEDEAPSDDEEDQSDDDDDSREGATVLSTSQPSAKQKFDSRAYREFLAFLEVGCGGSASVQGYPAVVVVLSTIPSSIFASAATPSSAPIFTFFESFWSALEARALSGLDRPAAHAAFLGALLDALVIFVRRASKDSAFSAALFTPTPGTDGAPPATLAVPDVVRAQFEQLWSSWAEGTETRKLHVPPLQAAGTLAKALIVLQGVDELLFEAGWSVLAQGVRGIVSAPSTTQQDSMRGVLRLLRALRDAWSPSSPMRQMADGLVNEAVEVAVKNIEVAQEEDTVPAYGVLGSVLEEFGEVFVNDTNTTERLENQIRTHTRTLLEKSPSILLQYISLFSSTRASQALDLWRILLRVAAQRLALLTPLLSARNLPEGLTPVGGELDDVLGRALGDAIEGREGEGELAVKLLSAPERFVSADTVSNIIESLVTTFCVEVDRALMTDSDASKTPTHRFRSLVEILGAALTAPTSVDRTQAWAVLLPSLFLLARLVPIGRTEEPLKEAVRLWEEGMRILDTNAKAGVTVVVEERLAEMVGDTSVLPSPEEILRVYKSEYLLSDKSVVDALVPRARIDKLLASLPSHALDTSLGVYDLLVPPTAPLVKPNTRAFDSHGYSSYARNIRVLAHALTEDRQLARANVWALAHLWAFGIHADDWVALPLEGDALLKVDTNRASVEELANTSRRVASYLASRPLEEGWHAKVTAAIQGGVAPLAGLDELGKFFADYVGAAVKKDGVRESRVLFGALQHVFASVDKEDAERWLMAARKLEKSAPQTALAIVHAVTRFAPEPTRLDRYRNELAANLTGVPSSKANIDGLWLLRRLAAVAPDPASDIVFLPQQRAVQLVKACQNWVEADDDDDEDGVGEEVEGAMTRVFADLAPILQHVTGAHWDFIFDVIENNLENSSFGERSSLVVLAHTLRLVIVVQDLCSTNKSLKSTWQERESKILTSIRDMTAARIGDSSVSLPRSICRELALSIMQDLSSSFMDETTLTSMCHLVTDSSVEVQKMAYQMLHKAAKKRTESVVVEAGVDTDGAYEAKLPVELVELLSQQIDPIEGNAQTEFGYLLSWMLALDLFIDASIKVKSGYSDHLRSLDLISTHLLPTLYTMLGIYISPRRAFKLDMWSVDEYYPSLFDLEALPSIPLLAAHVYYRTLLAAPSLVRSWLDDCKDRQLLSAVTSYTSQHFSKIIIDTELARVKHPQAMEELVEDNLTVKVANNVNEVTAAYTIDEQQLELTLKLPSDWPLHAIEIRDQRPVGVPEDRWRAWVLSIKQIVWTQNGSVLDGLTLFKKNISLHFQGLVECAICYSIIEVTDGSLPRKPCRTCKNRFHSACLFKWFNSSHSSSCPLCRSEIL